MLQSRTGLASQESKKCNFELVSRAASLRDRQMESVNVALYFWSSVPGYEGLPSVMGSQMRRLWSTPAQLLKIHSRKDSISINFAEPYCTVSDTLKSKPGPNCIVLRVVIRR